MNRSFFFFNLEYIRFILYGLIQGLTEFIPVSSTAHLKIISNLFGIDDPGSSISAIIQLGSVFAILWYFRNDLFNLVNIAPNKSSKSFLYKKLFKSIFVGTLPFLFIGSIVRLFIPLFLYENLRSNFLIAIISILMAVFMFFADNSRDSFTNIKNHNYVDSLLIGISQAFAIIPGVSRSGITISTALLLGWERQNAAKYSFLLGLPTISLAAIVEFIFSIEYYSTSSFLPLIIGLISTFLSSLFAIDFLIKHLSMSGLRLFIYYRLLFGVLILMKL